MGRISDIENITSECEDLIGQNVAENMEREYYSGLTYGEEDDLQGAIVWRLDNVDSYDSLGSELVFFNARDDETAKELLDSYKEKAREEEIKKTFFELSDIPEEIINVFKENGFKVEKREGMDIYVKLSAITSNKLFMPKKRPRSILSLAELKNLNFRQGIANCLFNGASGINDDLALLPKEWYDEDISCAYMEDDRVIGFFLLHVLPDGCIMPVLLFGTGVDSNKNIFDMLRFSTLAASEKYDGSTTLIIRRHDEKSRKLSAYIFPKAKGDIVDAGEREEQ